MNYKKLLKKYMVHVQWFEGICFVPSKNDRGFTDDERKELKRIAEDIPGVTVK